MAASISSTQLHQYLESITGKLLASLPDLPDNDDFKTAIINQTTDVLRRREDNTGVPITMDTLTDPAFIKCLSAMIVTQATLSGSEENLEIMHVIENMVNELKQAGAYQRELHSLLQDQESILHDLEELLGELDNMGDISPEMINNIKNNLLKKLRQRMNKKMFKKLEKFLNEYFKHRMSGSLRDNLRKMINEIRTNLDRLKKGNKADNKISPVPEDIYINLFGLLNSYITGSISIPLISFIGNGLGFNDWNPNHGYANIDKINEISFIFGDSLGIEAKTLENYFSIEDDFVSQLSDLLRVEGISPEPEPPEQKFKKP